LTLEPLDLLNRLNLLTPSSSRFFSGFMGRGVRIAIVDSGVHAAHPHINGVAGGIGIALTGEPHDDCVDRLGHGTAVTAAIREKAPAAELWAIKVFDRELATTAEALVSGMAWAAARGAHLINLSLGTTNPTHAARLRDAVLVAAEQGTMVVAACESEGVRWLPGSVAGVVPVRLDWSCPRDEYRVTEENGRLVFLTSGYPRSIPGVPPERNLKGISFAVATMTGFAARACEALGRCSLDELSRRLARGAAAAGGTCQS